MMYSLNTTSDQPGTEMVHKYYFAIVATGFYIIILERTQPSAFNCNHSMTTSKPEPKGHQVK
jgi:hypothetical protein